MRQRREVSIGWHDQDAAKRKEQLHPVSEPWRYTTDPEEGFRKVKPRVLLRDVRARGAAFENLKYSFRDSVEKRLDLTDLSENVLQGTRRPHQSDTPTSTPTPKSKSPKSTKSKTLSVSVETATSWEHYGEQNEEMNAEYEEEEHTSAASDVIDAIYALHPSDVSEIGVVREGQNFASHLPSDIVDSNDENIKSLSTRQPLLYFHLFLQGLPCGIPQALRMLSSLLHNVSITVLSPHGQPQYAPNYHSTSGTVVCSIQNISPERLTKLNQLVGTKESREVKGGQVFFRVFGVTTKRPEVLKEEASEQIFADTARNVSVVLRGISNDDATAAKISAKFGPNSYGAVLFPNYIGFDQVGLGPAAGIFSHKTSVQIGGAILSGHTDKAAKTMLHRVCEVNFMLSTAKEDLVTKRPFLSARLYGNIPPKYDFVKKFLDFVHTLQRKETSKAGVRDHGTSQAFVLSCPEITQRFVNASCAAVWNHAVAKRLKINPHTAIVGDYVVKDGGSPYRIKSDKEAKKIPITDVVVPTLGSNLRFSEWPTSCGGEMGLAESLSAGGVDSVSYAKSQLSAVLLPEKRFRRVTAIAEDIEMELVQNTGFTRHLQGYSQNLQKISGYHKIMKGQVGSYVTELYPKEWSCLPCGKVNYSSAIRCRSCGDHKTKATELAGEELPVQDLAEVATLHMTFRLPLGASVATFLQENFALHSFLNRRDQPHIREMIKDSFSANSTTLRRPLSPQGARILKKRKNAKKLQRKEEEKKKEKKKKAKKEGDLPFMLKGRSFPALQMAHPTSPMQKPELEVVHKVFKSG